MPMYLFATSFGPEGFEGHLVEGGVARRAYIDRVLRSLGGKLVGFWYAYGDIDLYVIGELPDNNAATAFSMHVSSSGPVRARTVVLVTPEEFDQARGIAIDFRAPGAAD